ncbi:MAG: phosphoribosylglycinamide formyltransferase [Armatimonadota bacterium]
MPEAIRIGAMASGGGTNLQSIIDACEAGDINGEVVVVISDNPDAGALRRARNHDIEAIQVDVPKTGTPGWEKTDREIIDILQDREVDLVVLAGYMRIVGPEMVAVFRGKMMNIHPALLPAFPGVDVQWEAVEHGVKIAGATVHFVAEEYDTGPIIIQACVPVMAGDTGQDLADRILRLEHRIYPQAIRWFAEGRLTIEGRKVVFDEPPAGDEESYIVSPPLEAF